jgi:hypothetical protein
VRVPAKEQGEAQGKRSENGTKDGTEDNRFGAADRHCACNARHY